MVYQPPGLLSGPKAIVRMVGTLCRAMQAKYVGARLTVRVAIALSRRDDRRSLLRPWARLLQLIGECEQGSLGAAARGKLAAER